MPRGVGRSGEVRELQRCDNHYAAKEEIPFILGITQSELLEPPPLAGDSRVTDPADHCSAGTGL